MSDSPFKAYDIRGRIGDNLDADLAYRLGRAVARGMAVDTVVTGRDIRASSAELEAALSQGLSDGGCDVISIGLCGTEEVYFATDHLAAGAGVMVTASHNPIDYNGMKLVGAGAAPLSEAEFRQLEKTTLANAFGPKATRKGAIHQKDTRPDYVRHVTGLVDIEALPPVHLVANAGNGCAGPCFDALLAALTGQGAQIKVTRIHHEPDSTFPNGIPNPLLLENQPVTAESVQAAGADLGLAWDGDFDRCFFFDETGAFIPGEYMVGVIAQAVLARHSGARIVHDPRVLWNTRAVVAAAGGEAVVARTGHALIKAAMRKADAAYGGEMSAHHYFRDFMFCDSGHIPWLMVLAAMGQERLGLGQLVAGMRAAFPSSGEINFRVEAPQEIMARLEAQYREMAVNIDHLDGLSMSFAEWRFNLRMSNTEPLLRLNLETRGDAALLQERLAELTDQIRA
ncbi:MAG: phosphomannomutase [Pseudomonadota bacterium]